MKWRNKMTITSKSFSEAQFTAATTIYNFFKEKGLTSEQACGIVAQAQGESSFNQKAIGDKDHAFGDFQLHMDRISIIKKGDGIDIHSLPSTLDQCAAVWYELNHSEHTALAKLKATTNAYDAGSVFCEHYERPASSADYVKRGNFANDWQVYFMSLKN